MKQKSTLGRLNAHFAKIGQEDSILLEQNGKFVLVDTGRYDSAGTINALLDDRSAKRDTNPGLNAIIITHYDSDHIGGLLQVLNHINNNVGTLYGRYYDNIEYVELMYNSDKDGVYRNYLKFVNAVIDVSGLSDTYTKFNLEKLPEVNQNLMDKIEDVYYNGNWYSPSRTSNNNFYFGSSYITWMNQEESYFSDNTLGFPAKVNADSLVFRVGTESGNKMLFLGDTFNL